MSIEIKIVISDDEPDKTGALKEHYAALGYEPRSPTLREVANAAFDAGVDIDFKVKPLVDKLNQTDTAVQPPRWSEGNAEHAADTAPAEEPKKRTRRTKAEIEAEREKMLSTVSEKTADIITQDDTPQISTGDERIGPEDDAETAAQDAADEAAEVEASRDAAAPLTREDVREAIARYIHAFGMEATQTDVPNILLAALGPVPEGTKNAKGVVVTKWGLTAIPETQEAFAASVAAVDAAIAKKGA